MALNLALLRVVREALGVTQTDLAKRSNIAQGSISKYEKGLQQPSLGHLESICAALNGFPPSFFEQDVRPSGVLYRTRSLRSAKKEAEVRGRMNLIRFAVSRLIEDIDIVETVRFPDPDREYRSPEEAAVLLRQAWGIIPGPIPSVSGLIEHAGGLIVPANLGSDAVVAAYMNPLGERRRWFFVNTSITSGDRVRFSLAHELGHAVLHEARLEPDSREVEQESHRFAAEFVMPRADLLRDAPRHRLDLGDLLQLKLRYGISMQAALMSAHRSSLVTDAQKVALFKRMSANGWRTVEPGEVPVEKPFILAEVLRIHREEHGFSEHDLERTALTPLDVLADLLPDYFSVPSRTLRVVAAPPR